MGEADVELTVGDTVHLTLDNKAFQAGSVRCVEGNSFGVSFDLPLLRSGAGDDELDYGRMLSHRPRARRRVLNIPARLNLNQMPDPATVKNLSSSGMLLETSGNIQPGQHVLVRLGERPLVAAVVKWCKDGHIGVETTEPMGILSLVYSND